MTPFIGVSGRRFDAGKVFKRESAVAIQAEYLDAVVGAGGRAITLSPEPLSDAEADDLVGRLDGVVLTGGPDVDPARYGQEAVAETYGVSELQDSFETALFLAAQRSGTPVLAICRGLQLVNVICGGTMDQHITGRDGLLTHGIPNGGGGSDNTYLIEPGSLLADVLGASAEGRCHHHQAAREVGAGLVVTARTSDSIIEGLEYADRTAAPHWMLAAQWHPEETAPADGRLFEALVNAATHTTATHETNEATLHSRRSTTERAWGSGCRAWDLVSRSDLRVTSESMPPGTAEQAHLHDLARQVFLVTSGRLEIEIAGRIVAAGPGEAIEVAPGTVHQARNGGATTVDFIVVAAPSTEGDRRES